MSDAAGSEDAGPEEAEGGAEREKRLPDRDRLSLRFYRPTDFVPSPTTPEQGCFGCLIGIGILASAVIVWAFVYWWNEPSFHRPPDDAPSPPPAQSVRHTTPTRPLPTRKL